MPVEIAPPGLKPIEEFLAGAPIFLQPWWLEAVAPGAWGYAVVQRGETIAAVMPWVRQRAPLGRIRLGRPILTQVLGPWFRKSSAKYANLLAEQNELMDELIAALPAFGVFQQQFHYSIENWLPFYWHGFKQTTRYTYVLEDLSNLDSIWQGMDTKTRGQIRKAERLVRVVDDLGLEKFLAIDQLTFRRQGKDLPFELPLLRRLDEACQAHNARKILFAVDDQNRIHAAVYLVWTKTWTYFLMGGSDPILRSSGAYSLLVWEAIKFASTVSQAFDCAGSMLEQVECFLRGFGFRQKPYFAVTCDRRGSLERNAVMLSAVLARFGERVRRWTWNPPWERSLPSDAMNGRRTVPAPSAPSKPDSKGIHYTQTQPAPAGCMADVTGCDRPCCPLHPSRRSGAPVARA
jgi:hypothetical protein